MNFSELNFEIVPNHSALVSKFNRAFMRSCLCVFLFAVLPVFSRSSEISSETFFVFKMSSVMLVSGRTGTCVASGGWVDTLSTFLVASCLPPSCQNERLFFSKGRLTLCCPWRASCRFSTRSRLFAASYLFIFLWKYLRKSSFFFSTPVVKSA